MTTQIPLIISSGGIRQLASGDTLATTAMPVMVGDSGSGGTQGLVPAPTTGAATKFLRGDGTWQTASGSSGLTASQVLGINMVLGN